ncbi:hypothetical protein Tco_0792956 [Tanacetum coccineum]
MFELVFIRYYFIDGYGSSYYFYFYPVILVVSTEVPIALADPLVAPEVGAVFVISPTGVLDLVDYSSSFDSNPSEYSLPVTPELPLVSPFLCSDDSEADNESDPADQRARGMSLLHHHLSQSHSGPSTRAASPRLVDSPVRTPRCSEAYMRWRSIAPALADLLPRKRFKDSNSPEVSGEEHMETGIAATETITDLGISDGVRAPIEDGIDLGVEVAIRDTREDEEEFEAEASAGGTIEIIVDPLATGGISESIGGDIPDLEEELFTHKEEMDLETAQTTTTAKLPILKQGEYDMWRLRIEQYFQVQDYALWDVIENGNSFKPVAQTTTNADGTSTSLIPGPVTTEEKVQKKNDVKARSMLLMALPNEHLMTFNQYKDAKTLFAAIQTRFGGNEATKKTQKTLLKQMYENFSAPSTESLDSIFNRLQKIVSQLAILGENISQEDLNLKFLRSLPSEWNTHVVVWRNKPDLDTMSFDDLYNNFKIVKQEVKGTASSSSSSISTANTQVSPASTQVSTANLSDDTVYAFLASQPNGSQLVYKDLEQIHEDDIEEMDLKWQLALLSMRTRSYMADDEVPTNMALMDFSDSEVHNDKTCSKTCLKSFETLKTQLDDLRIEFNKSEFNLATYKRGLASVEEQLVFYKKNEVIFYEQLAILKRDISYKDSELSMLKSELEKLKQEKESNQLKIENFDNASKSLDKLIGSQIPDKSRKGVGFVSYNVVPPPPTGLFSPLKFDLSNSGLEEFQQPEFEGYGPKTSKSVSEDMSNEVKESPDTPLVKELVSDDKLEKKTVFPTVAKIEFVRPKQQEKPVRKPVKYAEMYRSQSPRGNQRNWNNQKSQQLGSEFVMYNKACFVCGSFDHVQANCNYHQRERVVSGNNYTRVNYNYFAKKSHPNAHRNMVPRAVLMKSGLRSLNTARPVTTAHPKTTVYSARPMSHFSKSAQSTVKSPYQTRTSLTNKNISQKVNTAKGKFYTARQKAVNTARPNSAVVNVVRANQIPNPTNSSLNEAKKTAVVTAVTTADAIGQIVKTTMQVTLMVTPALETPIECLRTLSKQNPSLGRLGSNFNNLSKKEKSPGAGTKVLSLNFLDYDI